MHLTDEGVWGTGAGAELPAGSSAGAGTNGDASGSVAHPLGGGACYLSGRVRPDLPADAQAAADAMEPDWLAVCACLARGTKDAAGLLLAVGTPGQTLIGGSSGSRAGGSGAVPGHRSRKTRGRGQQEAQGSKLVPVTVLGTTSYFIEAARLGSIVSSPPPGWCSVGRRGMQAALQAMRLRLDAWCLAVAEVGVGTGISSSGRGSGSGSGLIARATDTQMA